MQIGLIRVNFQMKINYQKSNLEETVLSQLQIIKSLSKRILILQASINDINVEKIYDHENKHSLLLKEMSRLQEQRGKVRYLSKERMQTQQARESGLLRKQYQQIQAQLKFNRIKRIQIQSKLKIITSQNNSRESQIRNLKKHQNHDLQQHSQSPLNQDHKQRLDQLRLTTLSLNQSLQKKEILLQQRQRQYRGNQRRYKQIVGLSMCKKQQQPKEHAIQFLKKLKLQI